MAFAPAWVLDASSAMIAKRYIMGDMPLEAYTNRFSKSLLERYSDTSGDKLLESVEGMMNFMTTIKGENVLLVCDAFLHNRVCFESSGAPRKMKTMFRSALSPQKKQPTLDSFRHQQSYQEIQKEDHSHNGFHFHCCSGEYVEAKY